MRCLFLFLIYIFFKIKYIRSVKFNGFTIIFNFPNSSIKFKKGKTRTIIHSSFFSNLFGLYQRTIIIARDGGKIEIGSECGISGSTIYAIEEITIGNNVLIGGNCKIIDNDFHPLSSKQRLKHDYKNIKKSAIHIGDDCFIGANSSILKGTTIGNNCIVGIGSIVCGNFPDNVIIAGNPAKIIKENIVK